MTVQNDPDQGHTPDGINWGKLLLGAILVLVVAIAIVAAVAIGKQSKQVSAYNELIQENQAKINANATTIAMNQDQISAQSTAIVATATAIAAEAATPTPTIAPTATITPTQIAVSDPITTQVQYTGTTQLTASGLSVRSEIDTECQVGVGSGQCLGTFQVGKTGEKTGMALLFLVARGWSARVVCDDLCNEFFIVRTNGTVVPVAPNVTYPPNYDYTSLPADAAKQAKFFGINTEKSEQLAQHLFITPLDFGQGDYFVVFGSDDPKLGVNKSAYAAWPQ